jgi:hypothetical protein
MRLAAREHEARSLHPLLQQTAILHLQFGALLVAGWAAGWLLNMFA